MTQNQSPDGKITVRIVPTSGAPRTVEVDRTEAPLDAVLKEARVNGKNFQITVDGTSVSDLKRKVAAGAVVVLTEKARGS